MKYLLITIAATSLLAGCNSQSIRNFKPSEHITAAEHQTGVTLLSATSINEGDAINAIVGHTGAQGVLEGCGLSRTKDKAGIAAYTIPVVIAAGKYVFDSYMDKKTKDAEELKKASTATYSTVVHKTFEELAAARCIVVYRKNIDKERNEDETQFPFVAILALKPMDHNKSFSFSPLYVRAYNTVAMTRKVETKGDNTNKEEGQSDKINTTFAISVKTIVKDENGVPGLEELGTDVVTVKGVEIGPKSNAYTCTDDCLSSDLIPVLQDGKAYASVRIAVTEGGNLGIRIDDEIAEYKAFKEAFSDPLKEAMNIRLDQLYGEK